MIFNYALSSLVSFEPLSANLFSFSRQKKSFFCCASNLGWILFKGLYRGGVKTQLIIIKDLIFNEIDLLTEDKHKESGLFFF